MIRTIKPALRTQFIHRNNSFKPTLGNAALLGFTGGCALTTIVFVLCAYFTR